MGLSCACRDGINTVPACGWRGKYNVYREQTMLKNIRENRVRICVRKEIIVPLQQKNTKGVY